jgi:hypothetical protein
MKFFNGPIVTNCNKLQQNIVSQNWTDWNQAWGVFMAPQVDTCLIYLRFPTLHLLEFSEILCGNIFGFICLFKFGNW